MSAFYFYSDVLGWTFPLDIGAKIESDTGTHIWQHRREAEQIALAEIYSKLLRKYLPYNLSDKALDAKLKFEIFPTVENLITMAEIFYEETKKTLQFP